MRASAPFIVHSSKITPPPSKLERLEDEDHPPTGTVISFGPFRLYAPERLLKKGDQTLPLGGRALDVLIALVERSGEVVTQKELISHVWRDVTVEEANLRVQIASLRKVLGEGREGSARYVVNVPGRGYCFVAPVTRSTARPSSPAAEVAVTDRLQTLPPRLARMVGRADTIRALSARLMKWRFVSIVGPGGIGKTTVAVSVAHALFHGFAGAVFFIDLAPLTDPQLVPTTVASALGFMAHPRDPLASLVAFFGDRKILLVLDNCEHMIDVAAPLAERLVSEAPQAHVLATSREALRAEGEHVHLLYALDCPAEDGSLTAGEVLRYPAIQLFMERAAASGHDSELSDAESPIVARICRRLDGIPLAIELAASRVGSHGIHGIAELLDNRFGLLWQGRRTALPRHRTLHAMLDWSYNLLAEQEKVVLRRLSVFVGDFTLEAARSIASETPAGVVGVIAAIASLVEKSLISTSIANGSTHYRLLDTTRSYALQKLHDSAERGRLARQHAEYFRGLFERAEAECEGRLKVEWLSDYGRQIDNLRAALEWAFSPGGDKPLAVALTTSAVHLWMRLSLVEECRSRVEQALAALADTAGGDTLREMKLYAALGLATSSMHTKDAALERRAIWTKALAIAESLSNVEYQLRSLWGLYSFHIGVGQFRVALESAQRFRTLAAKQSTKNDRAIGDRMIGFIQHLLGYQASARTHIEHMLALFVPSRERSDDAIRFLFDPRVVARTILARTLWLSGFPDRAIQTVKRGIDEARETDHALSLCYTLAHAAFPTMLWVGDFDAAEHYVSMLLDHSTRHALPSWGALGRTYQGVLAIRRGGLGLGLSLLRAGSDEFQDAMYEMSYLMFLSELAVGYGRAGRTAEGLRAAEQAIARAERTKGRWLSPELLRIKGELLLSHDGAGDVAAAAAHFQQAVDRARRQGALSWELRAATSAARLLRDQGRSGDALALLQQVCARFTEGSETADLKAAKALLDECRWSAVGPD